MTLPYSDPSNPALPSPLFSDLAATRGDHMRANNAAIFTDLANLDTRLYRREESNSTASSGGTLTLTVADMVQQLITGTLAHTIVLPVVSTLYLGFSFIIINNSTQSITVNSSGSNLVKTVLPGRMIFLTCILISGTTAASWNALDLSGDVVGPASAAADIIPTFSDTTGKIIQSSGRTMTSLVARTGDLGLIRGELLFNSTTVPPYVGVGVYEINDGTIYQRTTDLAYAVGDILGDQALRPYYWYGVFLKNTGAKMIHLLGGGTVLKTYNITSISGGNTINFSSSAGGTQPAAAMIAVIQNATTSGNNGFWPITSVAGSPVTSVTVTGTLTNQAGAAGTVQIYYLMDTLHGAGTLAGVTTAAQALWYTPSPADALYGNTHDWCGFDYTKNGYYSKWDATYRLIGIFSTDASSHVLDVISYRSGRNKNDNIFNVNTGGSICTNATRFTVIAKCWGNDYTYVDDASHGARITANRQLRARNNYSGYNTGAATSLSIELNGTDTLGAGTIIAHCGAIGNNQNMPIAGACRMNKNDFLKFYSTLGLAGTAYTLARSEMEVPV